ncbi:MAG: tetratricopeptide repeat protein [Saprospiraceae bacterium]|nr:tetratricopeptide repeat protein [Saprospiraceae bacterium]
MRRKLGLITVWIFGIWCSGYTQADPGQAALERQDFRTALAYYQSLADTQTTTLYRMAYCQNKLGQWKDARENYERVIRQDTAMTPALLQLGGLYEQEWNYPKAFLQYRRLVKLDPVNPTYYKLCGQVAEKAGIILDAFHYYAQARSLNPDDIDVLLSLGNLFANNEQVKEADSLFYLAFQLDSTNLQVLLQRAKTKYALRDYALVVKLLERTRGRLDLNPYYQKMFGYAYLQIDSVDKAIHILENLLEKDDTEYTHYYLGMAYTVKEDPDKAIFHLEQAVQKSISPNIGLYYAQLGLLCKQENKWKEAIQNYDEAYAYSGVAKYLFFKAQVSDLYYKDKTIALKLYQKYLATADANVEYTSYANDRIRYLKEFIHQSKSNQ